MKSLFNKVLYFKILYVYNKYIVERVAHITQTQHNLYSYITLIIYSAYYCTY